MTQLIWLKEFYWLHRVPVLASTAGVAVGLLQLTLIVWTVRRLQELGHMRERMSRLADGLALLTDTTEAGLSTLMREMQQINRRPAAAARAGSRSAIARRVTAAARAGHDVAAIATSESLSESEIRLHMKLAEASAARNIAP